MYFFSNIATGKGIKSWLKASKNLTKDIKCQRYLYFFNLILVDKDEFEFLKFIQFSILLKKFTTKTELLNKFVLYINNEYELYAEIRFSRLQFKSLSQLQICGFS